MAKESLEHLASIQGRVDQLPAGETLPHSGYTVIIRDDADSGNLSYIAFAGTPDELANLKDKISKALPAAIGSVAKLYTQPKLDNPSELAWLKVQSNYTPNSEFKEHVVTPLVESGLIPPETIYKLT